MNYRPQLMKHIKRVQKQNGPLSLHLRISHGSNGDKWSTTI